MIAAQVESINNVFMNADHQTSVMNFIKFAESVKLAKLEAMHAANVADTPPKDANLFIYWILPREDRDEVLGDLEEGYYKVMKLSSPSAAKWWYWCQTARSIVNFIVCRVYQAFEKVRKLFSMR
jgi:hypothetical protein